ncbi:MAG: hypothetical protein HRU19_28205 [Pseudobacteriovorax sp.]|nr:hypothetical protein [Pseudobacteriovorax sp.]
MKRLQLKIILISFLSLLSSPSYGKVNQDFNLSLESWYLVPDRYLNKNEVVDSWGQIVSSAKLINLPTLLPPGKESGLKGTLLIDITKDSLNLDQVGLKLYLSAAYLVHIIDVWHDKPSLKRLIGSSGNLAWDQDLNHAPTYEQYWQLPNNIGERRYVVIHFSRFSKVNVQFTSASIESYKQLRESERINLFKVGSIAGLLLFTFIYNFSLFRERREDRGPLLIACFSLAFLLRFLATEDMFDAILFQGSIVWSEITQKIRHVGLNIAICFYVSYLHYKFPQFRRWMVVSAWAIMIPYLTLVALSPMEIYNQFWQVVLVLFFLFIAGFVSLIRLSLQKVDGAIHTLVGTVCIWFGGFNDYFVYSGYYDGPYMLHWAFIAFIFIENKLIGIRFARAFRTAKKLSRNLQLEVDRQTRDMTSILESINQGLITVADAQLLPGHGHGHSTSLKKILGKELDEHVSVLDQLFSNTNLSPDATSKLRASLIAMIGEDDLNFFANEPQLPRSIEYHTDKSVKQLEIDWSPILNKSGQVEKLLICLRDVTEIVELKQLSEQNEKEIKMMFEISQTDLSNYASFMKSAEGYLTDNKQSISQDSYDFDLYRNLYINYHTLKGLARTFYFSRIADEVHLAEDHLASIRDDFQDHHRTELIEHLERVKTVVQDYADVAKNRLHYSTDPAEILVAKKDMLQLIEGLTISLDSNQSSQATKPQLQKAKDLALTYVYKSISHIVSDSEAGIRSTAKQLGKEVPVLHIDNHQIALNEEGQDLFSKVFVHLSRNSLDHGIESPKERSDLGKSPKGNIYLSLTIDGDLQLSYWDDGRGLNLEKLRKIGIESGNISDNEMNPDRIAELIFSSGLSTKSDVTEISGRGVGMDAVSNFLKEVGGDISIHLDHDSPGKYQSFAFHITFPKRYMALLEYPTTIHSRAV